MHKAARAREASDFMPDIFDSGIYWGVVAAMACLAPIVFICLQRITAGYGVMRTKAWGPAIGNRVGWVLMEAPAFAAMLAIWLCSARRAEAAPVVMALLFELHYFQRSFIFPMLIRGRSKMPLSIIAMGITFNTINAYMLGGWIFFVSPADAYPTDWLWSPLFILGTIVFVCGMGINLHSDHIIRNLRKPGDTGHYIPRGGMYRFVSSANYFGEFVEWVGFAILTWSVAGAVFALWTFANLAPRAGKLHERYLHEFGSEYADLKRRRIIPFIY